ncbi:MAG: PAS domain-containing protein, partial [Arcobacteraceae bacterium]|nr:PAS domain-containing protein [Arcobacteraceae bacterium]
MEKNIQDNINITSSNSLNIMQQIAKIGSWQYKIEENKIVWDDEIYTIFGIDKESDPILNIKDFLNCIHIDDGYKFFQNYTEHLKTKLPYRTVYRIKTPQNEIKYIEERCETIYDEENNPIITNGTFQDITEHQLTLLDLNQHKLHLAEQAKFSAMGEMISMIAHQW